MGCRQNVNEGPPNSLEGEEVNNSDLGGGALGGEEEGRTQSQPAVQLHHLSCSTDPGRHSKARNRGSARRQLLLAMCGQCLAGPGSWP